MLPNFAVESFGFTFIYPFNETELLVYAHFYIIYEHLYPVTHPPTLRAPLIQAQIIFHGYDRPLQTADCSSLHEPSL
jgi:hypothetical protein